MTLRGSVCLCQGEELGPSEAELAFEDLHDPQGIAFLLSAPIPAGAATLGPWRACLLRAPYSAPSSRTPSALICA